MMFPVNNKLVLKKLTKRMMKANKVRNLITLSAIAMTAFLISTLFSIGMSTIESFDLQKLRILGSNAHIELTSLTGEQITKLKSLNYVEAAGMRADIGKAANTPEMGDLELTMSWYDRNEWEQMRKPAMSNMVGSYPEKNNEIMLPVWILERLGITSPRTGMEIDLDYSVTASGKAVQVKKQKFVLSAYYTEYTFLRSYTQGTVIVSKDFMDKAGLSQTIPMTVSVRFKSDDFMRKINNLIQDVGISDVKQVHLVPFYNESSIFDFSTMAGLFILVAIILLSGYLLIYNVLYISVAKDVRFYGLLKTIGTTPGQIKKIVMGQALRLAAMGIPLGLISGIAVSFLAVPMVIKVTTLETGLKISFSPFIFIGAAVFTLAATIAGSLKPAEKAGDISPVEAIRFTGVTGSGSRRKSTRGGSLYKMAVRNIFRERKRAALVFSSLFLGMTTFLIVNTLLLSMDIENLVDDNIHNDFRITNNTMGFLSREEPVQMFDGTFLAKLGNIKETDIQVITRQEVLVKYEEGIYDKYLADRSAKSIGALPAKGRIMEKPELFQAYLVGVDTKYIKQLNKNLKNPIDTEAFEKGEIILFSTDSPGLFQPGSGISFSDEKHHISSTIKLGGFLPARTSYNGAENLAPNIYISNVKMRQLYKEPMVYAITVDAGDKYARQILSQIKELIGYNKGIKLESGIEFRQQMDSAKKVLYILGGGMSVLLALIGIMNFINVMVTGVNVRRNEFAVMESIGMTSKQLKKMLSYEGLAYGVISYLLILLPGSGAAYGLFRLFKKEATYAVFTFPVMPLLITFVIVFAVCLLVPVITYKTTCTESITERLRSIEG